MPDDGCEGGFDDGDNYSGESDEDENEDDDDDSDAGPSKPKKFITTRAGKIPIPLCTYK